MYRCCKKNSSKIDVARVRFLADSVALNNWLGLIQSVLVKDCVKGKHVEHVYTSSSQQ